MFIKISCAKSGGTAREEFNDLFGKIYLFFFFIYHHKQMFLTNDIVFVVIIIHESKSETLHSYNLVTVIRLLSRCIRLTLPSH